MAGHAVDGLYSLPVPMNLKVYYSYQNVPTAPGQSWVGPISVLPDMIFIAFQCVTAT